jgi:hypothetical protein
MGRSRSLHVGGCAFGFHRGFIVWVQNATTVKRRARVTVVGRRLLVAAMACVGVGVPIAGEMGASPPASAVPSAIAFWDSRQGLIGTGRCAGAGYRGCTGTIQLTGNGGRSFRVVFRTRRPIVGLRTAGPGGAIAVTDAGGSFRTLDRGLSWTPFRLRYAASFATPRIALGFHSYLTHDHLALALLATSDGGLRGGGEGAHAGRRSHLVRSSILSRRAWAGSSVSVNPARETRRRLSSARATVDVAGVRAPRKLATRAAISTAALAAMATPKASRSPPMASGSSGRAAARSTSPATAALTGSGSRRSPGPRSTLVAVPLRLEQVTASSCSVAARDWRGYWRLMTVGADGVPSIAGAEIGGQTVSLCERAFCLSVFSDSIHRV